MNLEPLTHISVPYPAIKTKTTHKIMVPSNKVSSIQMWLHSYWVKVYGERVDGVESTAYIYILSSLLLCKFTHKNVGSPCDLQTP
jgi:hypothetical protein